MIEDVYRANFIELKSVAQEVATQRATEFLEDFVSKLKESGPTALSAMADPGMQHAIYSAQVEYAKTGDKNLEELLVNTLVERARVPERNLVQIVLSESLLVAPKLTAAQLDVLTVVHLLHHTVFRGVHKIEQLANKFNEFFGPFLNNIPSGNVDYQYLVYSGCVSMTPNQYTIEGHFARNHPGIFRKGVTDDELNRAFGERDLRHKLFVPCWYDSTLKVLLTNNKDLLLRGCSILGLTLSENDHLLHYLKYPLMNHSEIRPLLGKAIPLMSKLFDVWDNSLLPLLTLTGVGTALGFMNIRIKMQQEIPLEKWIMNG